MPTVSAVGRSNCSSFELTFPPPFRYTSLPERGFFFMERKVWWKSKKVWGTLGAVLLYGVGIREGWPIEQTTMAAQFLFGGVVVEGFIDGLSAFATAWRKP